MLLPMLLPMLVPEKLVFGYDRKLLFALFVRVSREHEHCAEKRRRERSRREQSKEKRREKRKGKRILLPRFLMFICSLSMRAQSEPLSLSLSLLPLSFS